MLPVLRTDLFFYSIPFFVFGLYFLASLSDINGMATQKCNPIECIMPIVLDPRLKVEVVSYNLDSPVSLAFVDNSDILVLEKNTGQVRRIINGVLQQKPVLDLNVSMSAERGLVGITVLKGSEIFDTKGVKVNQFTNSGVTKTTDRNKIYVFLYFTESKLDNDAGPPLSNKLYRYEYVNGNLVNPKLLLSLPASSPYHLGGSMTVGPDRNLYITIGDLDNTDEIKHIPSTKTQNFKDEPIGTGGILRLTQDGYPVFSEQNKTQESAGNDQGLIGNGYPLNLYYAYGIRNSFGLDFDPVTGNLWDTENGNEFADEINLVEPGFNSGWRKVQGFWEIDPVTANRKSIQQANLNDIELVNFNGKGKYSGPELVFEYTIGPTAIEFFGSDKLGAKYKDDMFVGSVHFGTIYRFELSSDRKNLLLNDTLKDKVVNNGTELTSDIIFGKGFGGITDVKTGPDGYMYVVSFTHGVIYRIIPT